MTVSQRFDAFLKNIRLTEDQVNDGITKHRGVRKCLNKHYYSSSSETDNSILIGSWGKDTRVRPPRDIDVLFALPWSVYERFQQRPGNKQSQLLQEVKGVLQASYSTTRMRGDGQVVVVPFTSFAVEVAPGFRLSDGKYWVCDTNSGGSYKTTDPATEQSVMSASDSASNGNTRHLVRMMKKWQDYCAVPLKSFCIELVATEFIAGWEHKGKSSVYCDWMVRDFLKFLIGKANGYVFAPGTYDAISLGDAWKSKAENAHGRAIKACEYEAQGKPYDAGLEWQKIFGTDIPVS